MEYSRKIYARIGELMQGYLSDGRAFMVSGFSSARWYSEAWLDEDAGGAAPGNAGKEGPPLPPKTCRALSLLLERTGRSLEGRRIGLRGNIPPGKGMSSSSTDILSVLSLVNDQLDIGLSPAALYSIASAIEPTDPCLSADILLFYQHSGMVGKTIGLPPMSLIYFDVAPDHRVDTENVRRPWTSESGRFFDGLLAGFLQAAEAGDTAGLFDCVTASAEYNQAVVALPRFDTWHRLARETGSGLMVAHSGTIAGLLTLPERSAVVRARLEAMAVSPVYTEDYLPVGAAASGPTFKF
jgi:uncharacterized protein involved in propanediol utilization